MLTTWTECEELILGTLLLHSHLPLFNPINIRVCWPFLALANHQLNKRLPLSQAQKLHKYRFERLCYIVENTHLKQIDCMSAWHFILSQHKILKREESIAKQTLNEQCNHLFRNYLAGKLSGIVAYCNEFRSCANRNVSISSIVQWSEYRLHKVGRCYECLRNSHWETVMRLSMLWYITTDIYQYLIGTRSVHAPPKEVCLTLWSASCCADWSVHDIK